jgi:nucleotide-binding universal stress UspA family protein
MDRLSLIQHSDPLIFGKPCPGPISRIAYPTTLTESSNNALQWAVQIAKAGDADLVLFHVLPPPVPLFEAEPFEKPEAETALSLLTAQVNASGVRTTASLLTGTDSIGKQILSAARIEKIDLIVMGTHGRTRTFKLFFGSGIVAKIVAHAECPVLVIPCNRITTVGRILHG